MSEVWTAVHGFEQTHEVSSDGRVRTIERLVPRRVRQRVLRLHRMPDGYLRVTLSTGGKQSRLPVHRLVARAFHGEPPSADHQVNHINGNKSDNRVGNLEWVTRSRNALHSYETGLQISVKGSAHGRAKLTDAEIEEIKALSKTMLQRELAERFGVSRAHISRIVNGRRWGHSE